MSIFRNGCHAAPLHESLPVAWHRLTRAALRRPKTRPATPDAAPDEGTVPVSNPPIPAGAVPLIDTVLLAVPGENPYPVREPGAALDWIPEAAEPPSPEVMERILKALRALPEVTP